MTEKRSVAEIVTRTLKAYIGPTMARLAMKTFAEKSLGVAPEALTVADVPKLIEAMRPMLKIMLGKDRADAVIAQITRECGTE